MSNGAIMPTTPATRATPSSRVWSATATEQRTASTASAIAGPGPTTSSHSWVARALAINTVEPPHPSASAQGLRTSASRTAAPSKMAPPSAAPSNCNSGPIQPRVTAVLTRKMPASVTRATPAHRRTDSIPHSNGFAERAETCGPVGGPGGAEENGGGAPVGTAPGGGGGARWGATEALVRSAASKMATRSVRSCTWRSMSMMRL